MNTYTPKNIASQAPIPITELGNVSGDPEYKQEVHRVCFSLAQTLVKKYPQYRHVLEEREFGTALQFSDYTFNIEDFDAFIGTLKK